MSYIGNTATTQSFVPAIDYFNGNGVTTAFTLSRPVASVAQVQAVIENVPQNPGSAFSVSGNTITFTSAPPSGTSNIYVYYTSLITQVVQPGQGTVGTTQLADSAVTVAKLSATGTPGSSTFLRGDGQWQSAASPLGGQAFTYTGSAQTFTIPTGVSSLKVTIVGGGGTGGAANYSAGCPAYQGKGGGGGAGGTAVVYLTGVTSGNTITVTVGNAAGASSISSGTQTIATTTATAGSTGGTGAASPGVGGAGGGGSGATYVCVGMPGASGSAYGGNGGSSTFGGGGLGASNGNGGASSNYGGGGGGALAASANRTGGAGAAGIIVFEW